jgi:PAS domain S-box-containing protein
MKGPFERTIAIGAALLALFLLANAFVSYRNVRHLRDEARWVVHTGEVIESVERLFGSISDIESAQRGYILTQDRRFLSPADHAFDNYDDQLGLIRTLTHDSAQQSALAAKLTQLVERRVAESNRSIELVDQGDLVGARRIVESGVGMQLMEEIRQACDELQAHEQSLLRGRQEASRRSYENTVTTVMFSTAVGLTALAIFTVLLARHLSSRARFAGEMMGQKELFRSTLASIEEAVITTDLSGRIQFMNPVAEALTGWTIAEGRGELLDRVFVGVEAQNLKAVGNPALNAIGKGGTTGHTDVVLIARDQSKRPIEVSASPILDAGGHFAGAVLVFRDITASRATEAQLLKLAADLSEADRRKDEFLATLAHELRNPLAPIRNGLEILRLTGGNSSIDPVCEVMNRQLNHLVRLVDDLMDVSRITRNKLQLRLDSIDIRDAIHSAIETCQPLLTTNGHELKVSIPAEPMFLNADYTRLAQIFSNLLNNASKYTEPGGRIDLVVTRSESHVSVCIRDTGVGISPESIGRVFDLFAQIDSSLERSQGGLGIGLMLVKRLVEMHGGSVIARSEGLGRGSEFTVRLPLLPEPASTAPSSESRPAIASPPRRVLVVDDNIDSAESLCKLLELTGNEVHVAHDGVEAVETAERIHPDVVLLDLGLPRMNGYDVCRTIRKQPGGDRVLVISQTGWGQDEDRKRSQEAGFDHHLVKPIDATLLSPLLAASSPRSNASRG